MAESNVKGNESIKEQNLSNKKGKKQESKRIEKYRRKCGAYLNAPKPEKKIEKQEEYHKHVFYVVLDDSKLHCVYCTFVTISYVQFPESGELIRVQLQPKLIKRPQIVANLRIQKKKIFLMTEAIKKTERQEDGKVECTGQYLILSQEELKSTNEWENKSEKHEVEQGCLSTDRKFKKTVKMAMAQNTLMEIDTIVGHKWVQINKEKMRKKG
ncbi:hypothetical protein RFI_39965 [Reticulomyxa filosa]|uniref:Uncharacterized protein n=1 Tax=Reticulomyxa filosa TaxID=46433 RepID=X6LA04_RETFI|nr:hypothetical protein RFI_39965 [Reticulomyxa filosa]|eukprot:ETN97564.1 hypothetical protein RFI_39965 [Reticulomyxa filosa]